MWTQEIINVVVENKETETFSKKYLWSHEDLNVHIQFVETYKWRALELTPEQYEAIEASSADTDTYDTQYNTESQYEILDTEGPLFAHEMCANSGRVLYGERGGRPREAHRPMTALWKPCRTSAGLNRTMESTRPT